MHHNDWEWIAGRSISKVSPSSKTSIILVLYRIYDLRNLTRKENLSTSQSWTKSKMRHFIKFQLIYKEPKGRSRRIQTKSFLFPKTKWQQCSKFSLLFVAKYIPTWDTVKVWTTWSTFSIASSRKTRSKHFNSWRSSSMQRIWRACSSTRFTNTT